VQTYIGDLSKLCRVRLASQNTNF